MEISQSALTRERRGGLLVSVLFIMVTCAGLALWALAFGYSMYIYLWACSLHPPAGAGWGYFSGYLIITLVTASLGASGLWLLCRRWRGRWGFVVMAGYWWTASQFLGATLCVVLRLREETIPAPWWYLPLVFALASVVGSGVVSLRSRSR